MGRLSSIIGKYNKKSKGAIVTLNEVPFKKIPRVHTGSFALDIAIGGGIPYGSIVEIFGEESTGKSLLALKAIIEAQKEGIPSVYIDVEGCSISLEWAKKVGVDPNLLYITKPKSAEEALNMMVDLAASGEVAFVVLDSIAALVPNVEIENELEANQMGVAARLMGKALRKTTSNLQPDGDVSDINNYNRTSIILINQTREKIGVIYGCFWHNTRITTDKGQLKIGDIVTKNIKCRVLSKNQNNELIYNDIQKRACTGESSSWIKLWTPIFIGSANKLLCTKNHEIFTQRGKICASDVKVGDYIYKRYSQNNYTKIYDKLIGMALGDSCIRISSNNSGLASMRFSHGHKQLEYLHYKQKLLGSGSGKISISRKSKVSYFESKKNTIFLELKKLRDKELILDFDFNKIKLESLLYWYLDDGTYVLKDKTYKTKSIQIASFRGKAVNKKILNRIQKITNINSGYVSDIRITLNVQMSNYLLDKWSELYFVPKCMQYKFKDNTKFINDTNHEFTLSNILIPLRVFNIESVNKTKKKYNLTIKNNHNYFANGILVGNSPLTTPGGKAAKFFSSIRVHLKRGEQYKDKETKSIVGQQVKFHITKNKTYKPFQAGSYSFYFDGHIDNEEGIIDYAIVFGLITQGGAYYTYETDKFCGKAKLLEFLKEKPKVLDKLKKDIEIIINKT